MTKQATIKYNDSTISIEGEGNLSSFFFSLAEVLIGIKDNSVQSISLNIDKVEICISDNLNKTQNDEINRNSSSC